MKFARVARVACDMNAKQKTNANYFLEGLLGILIISVGPAQQPNEAAHASFVMDDIVSKQCF